MSDEPIKLGIIGLGRWARVLTRSAQTSSKFIIAKGFSRSQGKRAAFETEYGVPSTPDLESLLRDPEIKGTSIPKNPLPTHSPTA
jgi:predicted dehydrogenase